MLCDYGCGNEGKFATTSGRSCCSERYNSCPAVRARNSAGISKAHKDGKMAKDIVPWNKGRSFPELIKADFSLNGKGNHKRVLLYERGHECEKCNNTTWLGDPIALELEHIDGNNKNNAKSNLMLLCPNCHAQTTTYRGKNIKLKMKEKVPDDALISAIANSSNIREALLSVGLVGKGANYVRCYDLIKSGVQLKKSPDRVLDKTNSQYGKIWICNLDKKENRIVHPMDVQFYLDSGWVHGRVMKFGQVAKLVETRKI